MTFFNPKTDILDVKLNTYGVELYSRGKFRPRFFIPVDSGMLYDDFDSDWQFRNYLRGSLSFLRPQRDMTFDSSVQNYDYFFENVSPYAVGSTLDTFVDGEKRTIVPNINIMFGSGKVESAHKTSNIIYIATKPIFTNFKEVSLQNETIMDGGVFEKGGKTYKSEDGYLFVEIKEIGSEFSKENFWLLVYEKQGLEYRQINLEQHMLSEYGLVESKIDIEHDVEIKIDSKIDEEYLCLHAEKVNNNNNIYITNKGTINVDLLGKMCDDKIRLNNFRSVYVNRKEKDLGDSC